MTTKDPLTIIPTQCHLWSKKTLKWSDMYSFVELERYLDESHLIRKLVKCSDCGQLYYYEFYEVVDWKEGNDPSYRTYFPIADKSKVVTLNQLSYIEILKYKPRLQFDWTDKKTVSWVK